MRILCDVDLYVTTFVATLYMTIFMMILFDDDFVDTDLQFCISSFEDDPLFIQIKFALHRLDLHR